MKDYVEMQKKRQEYKKIRKTTTFRHQKILELYFLNKTGKVLDFGCGTGSFKPPKNIQYYGFDIDKKNTFAKFHSLDEMKNLKFDYVILSHVIEHMELEELKNTLKWLKKHAKKIIIATPQSNFYYISKFWLDITHIRPYATFDLLYLIENAGFKITKIYYSDIPRRNPIKMLFQILLSWIMDSHPFAEFMVFAENE